MIIDENRKLDENQKRRVREVARERGFACGSCGAGDFEVGEALYLGFLFSRSLSIFPYSAPCPLTSAATALMKVSVTSSSSSVLRWGLSDRLRGDRLREES